MKKRILRAVSLFVLVGSMLTGCGQSNETTESAEERKSVFEDFVESENKKASTVSSMSSYHIYDYVDPETGVHYLVYSREVGYVGMGGITPRLNADGSFMVDK